jgi:Holliday junction resolvasome RuvABC endonuclease subunit
MKLFVGVDQALRKIGVSVIKGGRVELLKLIVPPADLRDAARLLFLEDALNHALEPFPVANGAAMEGQSYGSEGQLDQLGQIGGIVKLALLKRYRIAPLDDDASYQGLLGP